MSTVTRKLPRRTALLAPLSRRTILRGTGGITVALPFLDAMTGRSAHAQEKPLRTVIFFKANGTIQNQWFPTGGETDWQFSPILKPLEKHRSKLIVMDGLDMKSRRLPPGGNGHDMGMSHMLTAQPMLAGPMGKGEFSHLPDGSAGGPSFYQIIARNLQGKTRFSSIELGVQSRLDTNRQLTSRMIYKGKFSVVHPENDPREAWKTLFSGLAGNTDKVALQKLLDGRKSVLDRVLGDFKSLEGRLGSDDRTKLEAHANAIRELEGSLANLGSNGAANACIPPAQPAAMDHLSSKNFREVGRAQMDILALALACDQTRVISLQWSTAQSGVTASWLNVTQDHHSLSHEADDSAEAAKSLTAIDTWYAGEFSYLLDKLSALDEGGKSVLDNSAVLWANEQGNGDIHSLDRVPWLLAGSAGGKFRTGRLVKLDHASHADAMLAIIHAMGFASEKSFGHPDVSTGPLGALS